jgi:hypothetical protein
VKNDAANQLHVEVTHSGAADARFSNDGESLGQEFVERRTFASLSFILVGRVSDRTLNVLFENSGARAQLIVRKRLHRRFERVDLLDYWSNRLQESLIAATEDFS